MNTLVFCAGAPQPELSVLSELSDYLLIGVDGGAAALVAAGHAPDWGIGDFDSAPPPPECKQLLRLPAEKDDTDLEAALQHILAMYALENVSRIIILGALGGNGRLDHVLANIWLAHQPRFAAWLHLFELIEKNNSVRFFQAGSYELAYEQNKQYLSFIGLTPIEQLTLQGVKYEVQNRDYPFAAALISNEFSGSLMRFSFAKGLMCVMQTADIPISNT
ncbi:thiamine diphosphokinase [Neisseriaceae bacterium B1]